MRFRAGDEIFRNYRAPEGGFQSSQNSWAFMENQGIAGTSPDASVTAAQQATNWASVSQYAVFSQANHAGIRSNWRGQYSKIFEAFSFDLSNVNKSNFVDSLQTQALNNLIGVGLNFVSAAPVVGQILGAAVQVGQLIAQMAGSPDSGATKRFQRLIHYSRDTDEDMVDSFVRPILSSFNWTPLFMPSTTGNWELVRAISDDGVEIEGVKVWRRSRSISGFLGFLPGTQRQTQFVQVGPGTPGKDAINYHEISDTGAFYPSVAQFCTWAWEAAQHMGNPDMFKIETEACDDAWRDYYASAEITATELFDGSMDDIPNFMWLSAAMCPLTAWKTYSNSGRGAYWGNVSIGKEIPKDNKWPGCYWGPGSWGRVVTPAFGSTSTPIHQMSVYEAVVQLALTHLYQRQRAALLQTIAAAYIRFEPRRTKSHGVLPAFEAFRGDGTRAHQLREIARRGRRDLLDHPIKYTIDLREVDEVDEPYANDLRAAGVPEVPRIGSFVAAGGAFGEGEDEPPDSDGPQGGAPFDVDPDIIRPGKKGGGAGIVVIGAAALALMARRR